MVCALQCDSFTSDWLWEGRSRLNVQTDLWHCLDAMKRVCDSSLYNNTDLAKLFSFYNQTEDDDDFNHNDEDKMTKIIIRIIRLFKSSRF